MTLLKADNVPVVVIVGSIAVPLTATVFCVAPVLSCVMRTLVSVPAVSFLKRV